VPRSSRSTPSGPSGPSGPSASDRPAPQIDHEVLAAVLQVRADRLHVLLWRRALPPHAERWALPGGRLGPDEDLDASIRRQLAEKVDVREIGHLEQLDSRGAPWRVPTERTIATTYLGLIPAGVEPEVPADTRWFGVDDLPWMAFDHAEIVAVARRRLRSKLSYTNLGFALAPATFTMSELATLYRAALGHEVDATNLQRILVRRQQIEPTGQRAGPGPTGGRPAALFRFRSPSLQVTDAFAVLHPPPAR